MKTSYEKENQLEEAKPYLLMAMATVFTGILVAKYPSQPYAETAKKGFVMAQEIFKQVQKEQG